MHNHSKRVSQVHVKENMLISDLITELKGSGFGAGRLADACEIFRDMVYDPETKVFCGLAGALVPAGQREVIVEAINRGFIDVLVTTGATLTHDLIESLGFHHERGYENEEDSRLREQGISRIYDVFVSDEAFTQLEIHLHSMLASLYPTKGQKQIVSTDSLLKSLGESLSDPHSILSAAATKQVPIFCPAITDSILGLHIMFYAQQHGLLIDPLKELQEIINLAFDAPTTGALVVGGGVPKNYVFQSMLVSGKLLNYVVQITMDRPEHGGLSGASIEESMSWGKVREDALYTTVVMDATVALPIIVQYAVQNPKSKK
ncbi:MAG: deoxyhypusine synthase [Candidatus Hermodarchaeota archaeon]